MFCSQCGAQTNGASFCPNCGSPTNAAGAQSSNSQVPPVLPAAQPQVQPISQVPYASGQQTNGFAIAALVLSLVCCGPLAIIFGFIARKQIRESNGAQTGDGLALAGIIVGFVFTGLYLVYALFVEALLPSMYGYDY